MLDHGAKKLAIRCNASPFLGVGDLVCGLILAAQAQARGLETVFMVDDTPAAAAVLSHHRHPCHFLKPGLDPERELLLLETILAREEAEFLFVIRFDQSLAPYDRLKSGLGLGLGCVDFWRNFGPGMDLVVNWDPAAAKAYETGSYPGVNFLLGPGHVLLQDNVTHWARRERGPEPAAMRRALVSMGGSDWASLTWPALQALAALEPRPRVRVILGAATGQEGLAAQARELGLELEVLRNVGDMGRHLFWADLVLLNGGLGLFECLAVGRPALATSSYEHQEPRCRRFADQGALHYLGRAQEQDSGSLARALTALAPLHVRQGLAQRARQAVGLTGAALLVERILRLIDGGQPRGKRACA